MTECKNKYKNRNLETALRHAIVNDLIQKGQACKDNVAIVKNDRQKRFGEVDILTEDTVIEVKYLLTRESFYKALGQVLFYKQSIKEESGKELSAQIIYCQIHKNLEEVIQVLTTLAKSLGVTVKLSEVNLDISILGFKELLKEIKNRLEDESFERIENRAYIIGMEYSNTKDPKGGVRRGSKYIPKFGNKKTRQLIAEKYKINERTVSKKEDYAKAVDIIAKFLNDADVNKVIQGLSFDNIIRLGDFLKINNDIGEILE